MHTRPPHPHHQNGFALLAIAGLLIAASIAAGVLLMQQDRKQTWDVKLDSQANVKAASDGVLRFQRGMHHAPCPAPMNALPDTAGFGVAVANCASGAPLTGTWRVDVGGGVFLRMGALPTRTLGLNDEASLDAYGNRLTYGVLERATDIFQFSGTTGTLRLNDETGTAIISDGAMVLIAHGRDAKGAYSGKTGIMPVACTASAGRDQENCDNDDGVFLRASSNHEESAAFFDDSIEMLPVDMTARGTNRPCAPPDTASPFSWGACSATFTNAAHGSAQTLTDSVAPNTGSADVTCDNAQWVLGTNSCNP